MLIWQGIEAVPDRLPETVVTIGKFDGLHIGHQKLLATTRDLAATHGLFSVVVTFDRHPATLLDPANAPEPLCSEGQKAELLQQHEVDAVLNLHFDAALASLSADAFIEDVLVKRLNVRALVVGEEFQFGAGAGGDIELLRAQSSILGFSVFGVQQTTVLSKPVSSTAIRNSLSAGRIELAAQYLGRLHRVDGVVVQGKRLGREIGFPTANLAPTTEGYLPCDGVYAGWLTVLDEPSERYLAAISIGTNETTGPVDRVVEAYALDRRDLDLYGKRVRVEFLGFIREQMRFDSVAEMVEAIAADVDEVRHIEHLARAREQRAAAGNPPAEPAPANPPAAAGNPPAEPSEPIRLAV